jgi:hypothetical protein
VDDLIAFLTARLDEGGLPPRMIEALRAILAKYELGRRMYNPDTDDWFSPAAAMFGSDMEWLIRTLAAVHSDHPDYQQEWKP